MSNNSVVLSNIKKKMGYALIAIREFFNGYDSGGGIVKIPIWIAGTSVVLMHVPYVVTGGGIFGILFLVRAVFEEHQRFKEEQDKTVQKSKLEKNLQDIKEELENILLSLKLRREAVRLTGLICNSEIDLKFANKEILKYLLRDYFAILEEEQIEPEPGKKLPRQSQIFNAIHQATGCNPYFVDFRDQVINYFKDKREGDILLNFEKYFPRGIEKEKPSAALDFLERKWQALRAFTKKHKKLRNIGKKCIDLLNDFSTAAGISAGTIMMVSSISRFIPPMWPLIIVIMLSGVAYSLISLAYQMISGDRVKRKTHSLDEKIKQLNVQTNLVKQLKKIHKRPLKKLSMVDDIAANNGRSHEAANNGRSHEAANNGRSHETANNGRSQLIPIPIYLRMILGMAGRVISAISLSLIISSGLIWLGTILFPALPFTIPTLGLGVLLSINYLFREIKREAQAIQNELSKYQEVAEKKQRLLTRKDSKTNLEERDQYRNHIAQNLVKDNRVLLKELLEEYTAFAKSEDRWKKNNKLPNQEKIFLLIEAVVGIEREEEQGKKLPVGNDKFYYEIARFLKKGPFHSEQVVVQVVQNFKSIFLGKYPSLTHEGFNADNQINQKESKLKTVGLFIKNHGFLFLAAISLAITLPLTLMGPQMIILIPIAAIVVGAYFLTTITSHKAKNNMSKLDQELNKLSLIDRKAKIIGKKKTQSPQYTNGYAVITKSMPEPGVALGVSSKPQSISEVVEQGKSIAENGVPANELFSKDKFSPLISPGQIRL
jgi:Flp pilus assembly protein TadB